MKTYNIASTLNVSLANESEVDLLLLTPGHVRDLPKALVKQNLLGVRGYQS